MEDKQMKIISLQISKEWLHKIKIRAATLDIDVSKYIRNLIEQDFLKVSDK